MPGKAKENSDKQQVLKGLDAEDAILKYMKKMNRPFGPTDVSANLKGAVPKTATQKILASLAEKGDLTQKQYGKSMYYVAKQSDLEDVPAEKLSGLETQVKEIEDENRALAEELKHATAELNRIKNAPTDEELRTQLKETKTAVDKTMGYLIPLRSGTSLVSPEEIEQLDKDWVRWRKEWVERRKVFMSLWYLVSDSLPPQEAKDLAEELGVEYDTEEHTDVERGPLCTTQLKKR